MTSTTTARLQANKPDVGSENNTWGTMQNGAFDVFDRAIAGYLTLSVAGAADVTLSATQALNPMMTFTGILTGNINVIVPSLERNWHVYNNTTGAFTLTVKTAAGSGVAIPQSLRAKIACDATNVIAWAQEAPTITAFALTLLDDAAALNARATLGLVIGTDVLAQSSNVAFFNVAQSWSKPQRYPWTGLTDAATIAWDCDAAPYASVTIGANRTMGLPTNIRDGQVIMLKVGRSGSFTITTWNGAFDFGTAGAPTQSSTSGKFDIFCFVGVGTTKLNFLGIQAGFSQ